MAVAGFVFGLLSVAVFWWLGVTLGGIWAAGVSVEAVMNGGESSFATTPFWIMGLGIGVGLPVIAIVLSGIGLVKGQSKGIGLIGIVTGSVAALLGLGFTIFSVFTLDLAVAANSLPTSETMASEKKMQETLNDPAFQEQIMRAMKAAEKQQRGTTPDASEGTDAAPDTSSKESPVAPVHSEHADTGAAKIPQP